MLLVATSFLCFMLNPNANFIENLGGTKNINIWNDEIQLYTFVCHKCDYEPRMQEVKILWHWEGIMSLHIHILIMWKCLPGLELNQNFS